MTPAARLLAEFNRGTKRARDAYRADQSVGCAQCHTRRRRSAQRRCWMCVSGGPDQAAAMRRRQRARKAAKR